VSAILSKGLRQRGRQNDGKWRRDMIVVAAALRFARDGVKVAIGTPRTEQSEAVVRRPGWPHRFFLSTMAFIFSKISSGDLMSRTPRPLPEILPNPSAKKTLLRGPEPVAGVAR
jgi:hypothetical protein